MKNIVEFPDRDEIALEAAQWLARMDGDEDLDSQALQALRQWIQRSPAHREELISLSEFWHDQSLTALPIDLDQLCYDSPPVDVETSRSGLANNNWLKMPQWSALATTGVVLAMFILLSGGVGLTAWLEGRANPSALYATAVGQQQTVHLPDGSVLYLNTNSQVKVEYQPGFRNIHLMQGEAHFDVASQAQRPFRVYAGGGRVQAVGTAFTVFLRDNQAVDVVVSEGTVALAANGTGGQLSNDVTDYSVGTDAESQSQSDYYLAIPHQELGLLEAGYEATILTASESQVSGGDKLGTVKSVAKDELERRGAWRSGLLVFTGESLEDVIKELSRYTTLSIDIVDPALKKVRIGGRFSVDNTHELFNALEANFGLRITRLDYRRVEISSVDKAIEDK